MIRPMPRLDVAIHHEAPIAHGTVPDLVIAFSVPDKTATVGPQDRFYARRVILRHQATRRARSVRSAVIENGTSLTP